MTRADRPDVRVRAATPVDVPALSLIATATFLETFAGILPGNAIVAHCAAAYDPAALAAKLGTSFLAEAPRGAPVGFAQVMAPDLPGALEGDVELKRIYLLSRFHGTGAGAALLSAAIGAAAGHRRLLLGVYAHNGRAIAFYRKNGFELIGERRFDVGGQLFDDVVLARPL